MGTDIHLAAEYYKDGCWHLSNVELPNDRNYRAFAILANVRNGCTFAGFDTGDFIIPISDPRGLPDDMSEELRALLDSEEEEPDWQSDEEQLTSFLNDEQQEHLWLGDHSFSWVTLQELMNYDLDQPVTLRGMVSPEAAQRWQEYGEPPIVVAGYSSQPDWVHLQWHRPLRESAPLIQCLIAALIPLGDPPDVRLVFGFDN
ncbi:MAG: hypothetical protein AB2L18_06690 [Anaerolineaceae bacterium]